VERYWKILNIPVLDKTGTLLCILHKVEDSTDFIRQDRQLKELTSGRNPRRPLVLWLLMLQIKAS
jgi:hypothetical protein